MIHCNLFSHIYIYILTYVCIQTNVYVSIYERNVITVLPLSTYTVHLTVNTCLDKIWLSVALMGFLICNLADFCRSYSTMRLLQPSPHVAQELISSEELLIESSSHKNFFYLKIISEYSRTSVADHFID